MGAATKMYGLDGLGVPEKVDLINELWEEVVSSAEAVPIDKELGEELERRLAAYRADPSTAVTPEQLKKRIRNEIGE